MTSATELLVAYWPLAAVAGVLLLLLLLPVRRLMRRSTVRETVAAPPSPPPPPPTPVQRLAASIEQAQREKAQTAKVSVGTTTVPPPPRPSAWTARLEPLPAALFAPEEPPARNADSQKRAGHAAFGRPRGLAAPRPEGRDDLKAIHGIGPRIERGLNALGVFHYDQIAAWDRRTVVWVENWFSLRGLIGRERWVEQAAALVPSDKPLRSVRA